MAKFQVFEPSFAYFQAQKQGSGSETELPGPKLTLDFASQAIAQPAA